MGEPKIHEFKKSLSKGKKAEAEFAELFKDKVEQLDGFMSDFRLLKDGFGLELKTDFYDPSKSINFFIEKFSYAQVPGGPWQALTKGSSYFCYWFPMTMQFHVWDTETLVKELDKITKDMYVINVFNSSHTTQGYKVPRHLLEHIELDLESVLNGKPRRLK